MPSDPKEIVTQNLHPRCGVLTTLCNPEIVTLIAHLSDTHVLEPGHRDRTFLRRKRLSMVSIGRTLDAPDREARLLAALREADRARADHIVLTGDLTEDGDDAQFEALADILKRSGILPSRITLIPGNHDYYESKDGYDRALRGPLAPWHPTSQLGVPLRLHGVILFPISTAIHQHWLLAEGSISAGQIEAVREAARSSEEALAILQHHPPNRQWLNRIDGLREHAEMGRVLDTGDHVHVLHGHTHIPVSRHARAGDPAPRIFCAPAVVDNREPLRLYRAHAGRIVPADDDLITTPLSVPSLIPSAG